MASYSNKVLREIRKILRSEENREINIVPLSLILDLIKIQWKKEDEMIDNCEKKLNKIVKEQFGEKIECVLYEFNYCFNTLIVGISLNSKVDFKRVMFRKEDNHLYIIINELENLDKELLKFLQSYLLELYDKYMSFSEFEKQSSYNIQPINTMFKADITSLGVRLYFPLPSNKFKSFMSLDDEKINCENKEVVNEIHGLESEILKKVYVNLDNCPPWSRGILHETRKYQFVNNLNLENKVKKINH